jgi:signal transduction histidine kinase
MKFGPKLITIFLCISIIPMIFLMILSFSEFSDNLVKEQQNKVESIINAEESDINHLIILRQEQAKMIAGTFLPRQLDSSGVNDPKTIENIQTHIDSIYEEITLAPTSNYDVIDTRSAIDIIGIWDKDGTIVANTQRDLIGKKMPDIFLEQVRKSGTYFAGFQNDPLTDRNFLIFLESIRDWEDGEFAGVVLLKIRAEILNNITTQSGYSSGNLGDTGELYLVDSDYFLITESRFTGDAILNENAKSNVIVDCFNGLETSGQYTNFRGSDVLGVTKYLHDQDWCLVGEAGVEEVYEPITALRNEIILVLLTIIGIVAVIAIFFAGTISKPILKLTGLADKISEGDLDFRVKVQGKDELGHLTERMNETSKTLKNSLNEKEDFVAMITHDLKQPLVPIAGNAEMLKNPKVGELNEMQKECVEEIQANASRQLAMIDNLVSAQKIGAGAMTYEIEDISSKEILAECIKTHTPAMTDKNLKYFDSSTIDVKIKGDNRRIQEAFTNLILNAHDFVPDNGNIEIGVTDGEKEATFFVKDDGEGIPKEKQDQLFKKYGQVKSDAKRKFGGTGLGLAVSQELVNGMGGKIGVESEEGKGSTFFFTIPKAG